MNCLMQSNGQELCCCPGRWFVNKADEYPLPQLGEPLRKSTLLLRCFFLNPSIRTKTLEEEVRKFACKANLADEYPLSNRREKGKLSQPVRLKDTQAVMRKGMKGYSPFRIISEDFLI